MKRSISIFAIMLFGTMSAIPSHGVQMTGTIRNLMQQKEDKIKQLEECEGKKKGWMIAGISTIGLTAVGVGVNIVQANKSNKLSSEIEENKQQLERQQERLDRINDQISAKEREKIAEGERGQNNVAVPQDGALNDCMLAEDKFCLDLSDDDDEVIPGLVWKCKFGNTESIAVRNPGSDGSDTTYCHKMSIPCDAMCTFNCPNCEEDSMVAKDLWNYSLKVPKINLTPKSAGLLSNNLLPAVNKIDKPKAINAPKDINVKNNADEIGTINISPKSPELLSNNQTPGKLPTREIPKVPSDVTIAGDATTVPVIENNKDMARLNSVMGSEGSAFNVNVPAPKPAKEEKSLWAQAEQGTICLQSGGEPAVFGGKCNCSSARGLTRSSDEKKCVCEKSGYEYNEAKKKCVSSVNRQDVSDFMDELDAKSKYRFL